MVGWMVRPMGWALAGAVVAALIVWRGPGQPALWTLAIGATIAAFLAGVVVLMQETLIEDLVKAALLVVVALALRSQGVPDWLWAPIVVGALLGYVGNRASERRAARAGGEPGRA